MNRPNYCLRLLFLVLVPLLVAREMRAGEDDLAFAFDRDVMVPMRDGTQLATNIFRPKAEGRYEVILMRTPYGKPGEGFNEASRYVNAGFVVVAQDCRGRGKSGGVWEPFRYDAEDGFDTQEWIGRQPWCNGEIGTFGGSYVGWTQWASAPAASRYLKAMVPVVPFGDVFDEAYTGGAFQLALLMGWGSAVGGVSLTPDGLKKAYHHLPLRDFGNQFETKVSYLNDWVQHHSYDDYWTKRGIDHRYAEITVPTLNIGGWYDIFAKTTVELVDRVRHTSVDRSARRNQFVVMGPWAHGVGVRKVGEIDFGQDALLDIGKLQLQWFSYWLKGEETGVEDWPAYYLFVMGENRWRGEHEWPLKRTQFTPYYLHSGGGANSAQGDGMLNTSQPGDEKPDSFVYDGDDPVPTLGGNNLIGAAAGPHDQKEVEQREDVLVYSTAPLQEDVEVTGPVKMILYAASTAHDTDFTAKLVDVHPDGKAFNLCDGIVRARWRAGMDKGSLLEPGKVERYEIDLWVTSNLFRRGHRIRVQVSSSNFPRFDRNPNSGEPFGSATELLPATQSILHDAEHPSHLVLPVIPR
jgi:hypothetical protein